MPTMKIPLFATLSFLLLRSGRSATLVPRNLGYLEMTMTSTAASETNLILRKLLSVTVNFLDASFFVSTDDTFEKVSCSISSYQLGGVAGEVMNGASETTSALYTAVVNVTGQAFFLPETLISQSDISTLTADAFDTDDSFVQALRASSDPFLANVRSSIVKVNGYTVSDERLDTSHSGFLGFFQNTYDKLEMWMVALIAGGIAFLLVLCCVLTCICCINVDDEPDHSGMNKRNSNHQLGVVTTNGTGESSANADDEEDSKAPLSPVKSITSQDSSIFTYNPKSVRSMDSAAFSYYTSNTPTNATQHGSTGTTASGNGGVASTYFSTNAGSSTAIDNMDVGEWQKGSVVNKSNTQPFGHDISAISAKKDLSQIEEVSCEGTPKSSFSDEDPPLSSLLDQGGYRRSDKETAMTTTADSYLLTEEALADMDQNERRDMRKEDEAAAAEKLDLNGPMTNVMDDLHDLSNQIDQYRHR